MGVCPLCYLEATVVGAPGGYDFNSISCRRCGNFSAEGTMIRNSPRYFIQNNIEEFRYLLSAATRRAAERSTRSKGKSSLLSLAWGNLVNTAKSIETKGDLISAADELLIYLCDGQDFLSQWKEINSYYDYPLAVCKNPKDFVMVVNYLMTQKLVQEERGVYFNEIGSENEERNMLLRLTASGYQRADELKKTKHKKIAFVAMWFEKSLDPIYEKAIGLAIRDATILKPVRVDKEEHNQDINDWILSHIRQSAFLVADFTGNRSGVYLEAGFALGLGIPVIFTCMDTKEHVEGLHFDTNHRNHIFWKDEQHLYTRLVDRIRATVPLEYLKSLDKP